MNISVNWAVRDRVRPPFSHHPERDALIGLALASGVAGASQLWLSSGGTFFVDELRMFGASYQVDFPEWIEPWNGHLSITSRVIYKAMLELFGADYLAVRLLTVVTSLLTASVFFALARHRVGPVAALAPTIILLFFGSSWKHLLAGTGITVLLTIAAGLGALLALERNDLRGNLAACALITFALASFSVALAFLAGVIVAVMLRPRPWRSAWVYLIPLLLYSGWWVWALRFDSAETQGSNVLLIPMWILESLSAVAGGLLGVNLGLDLADPLSLQVTAWGRMAALLFVAVLAWRIRQGRLPPSFWVSLTIALTYWCLTGLVAGGDDIRTPYAARYIYPGAVALLLVATDAFRDIRFSPRGIAVLYGIVTFSLVGNIALLRAGSEYLQSYSEELGADLAMIEVASARVPTGFPPSRSVVDGIPQITAGDYLAAVGRFGSPAPALSEVRQASARVRWIADIELGRIYKVRTAPAPGARGVRCERRSASPGRPVTFELPAGTTTLLRIAGDSKAKARVGLRRFGDQFSVGAGGIAPRAPATLSLPADNAPDPWHAEVQVPSMVVCQAP